MPTTRRGDRPSDTTYLATGLFAGLADATEQGRVAEAQRARADLAALGWEVRYRRPGPRLARPSEGGGR
jgi:hypothetical protein